MTLNATESIRSCLRLLNPRYPQAGYGRLPLLSRMRPSAVESIRPFSGLLGPRRIGRARHLWAGLRRFPQMTPFFPEKTAHYPTESFLVLCVPRMSTWLTLQLWWLMSQLLKCLFLREDR